MNGKDQWSREWNVNFVGDVRTGNFSNDTLGLDEKSEEGCESYAITGSFISTGRENTMLQVVYTAGHIKWKLISKLLSDLSFW